MSSGTCYQSQLHAAIPLTNQEQVLKQVRQMLTAMCHTDSAPPTPINHYEALYTTEFSDPGELRAWRALTDKEVLEGKNVHEVGNQRAADDSNNWVLQYQQEPLGKMKDRPTLIRSLKVIPAQDKFQSFLSFIGFKFSFEYLLRGFMFQHTDSSGNTIQIRVYQIYAFKQTHMLPSIHRLRDSPWVVEATAIATNEDDLSAAETRLQTFCSALLPLKFFKKSKKQ
mmetsp:Transcript_27303/g.38620  ORF Transcript_27303/g.38620 Transcript_27303/m.38620 type:complete len:225 (+) Transcript_27303:44-718(+)